MGKSCGPEEGRGMRRDTFALILNGVLEDIKVVRNAWRLSN